MTDRNTQKKEKERGERAMVAEQRGSIDALKEVSIGLGIRKTLNFNLKGIGCRIKEQMETEEEKEDEKGRSGRVQKN